MPDQYVNLTPEQSEELNESLRQLCVSCLSLVSLQLIKAPSRLLHAAADAVNERVLLHGGVLIRIGVWDDGEAAGEPDAPNWAKDAPEAG